MSYSPAKQKWLKKILATMLPVDSILDKTDEIKKI